MAGTDTFILRELGPLNPNGQDAILSPIGVLNVDPNTIAANSQVMTSRFFSGPSGGLFGFGADAGGFGFTFLDIAGGVILIGLAAVVFGLVRKVV